MANTTLEIVEVKTELVIGAVGQQTVLEINEPPRIELLTVGVQGPKGNDGNDGHTPTNAEIVALLNPIVSQTVDSNFVHNQNVAAQVWSVNHNLGKYPAVTVVDSSGRIVVGDVTFTDLNSLTVWFPFPFGGQVFLN